MKKNLSFGFSFLLFLTLFVTSISAENINEADELSNLINKITEISTAPRYVIQSSVNDIAIENNMDAVIVAQMIFDDLNEENVDEINTMSSKAISTTLPTASFGDIWYSKATTSFYNHGHVALYFDSSSLIEARGSGYKVAVRSIYGVTAKAGDSVMMVTTAKNGSTRRTHGDRLGAVEWAENRLGSNYAYTVNNKSCGVNDYNCSQLVWCAYSKAIGIDLDSDGTWLVTPMDIKNSSWTKSTWSQ